MKTQRIIGIDPGTGRLGFGVVERTGKNVTFIDAGVITTPKTNSDADRLRTIYDDLTSVIADNNPQIMAVEKLFFVQNVTTGMTVSQARGVVLLLASLNHLELYEYTPLQIKQTLTGYGRADKKQIQEMVKIMLKLSAPPQPDDCADALAAAIVCAQNLSLQ